MSVSRLKYNYIESYDISPYNGGCDDSKTDYNKKNCIYVDTSKRICNSPFCAIRNMGKAMLPIYISVFLKKKRLNKCCIINIHKFAEM